MKQFSRRRSRRVLIESLEKRELFSFSVSVAGTPVTDAQTTPVDYGEANQQTLVSQTIHITNDNASTLHFSSYSVPTGFVWGGPFIGSTAGIADLAPGASTDVTIHMSTYNGGTKSGTLVLNSNDPDTPAFHIPLTGIVHYRKIEVSYNSTPLTAGSSNHTTSLIDFGSTNEGSTLTATFHVANTGDTMTLNLPSPTLPGWMSVVTPLPSTLAPGDSADLVVAIDTSNGGSYSDTLVINSDDPLYALDPSNFRIPVAVVVHYSRLSVTSSGNPVSSGTSIPFGTVEQGDPSTYTLHLSNTGDLPLTLSTPTIPTGFRLDSTFPTTLAPGESADILLALDTLGPRGDYSGAFTFTTSDTHNPTYSLNLSGKILGKGIVVSLDGNTIPYGAASTINFGKVRLNATGQQVTLTIRNAGVLPLDFQATSLPAGYTLVQSLPDSLSPGSSAQLTIALDTSATGLYNGTLHIVSSDPDRPSFDIPLSASVSLPVKLGAGGAPSITFKDADGTLTTLKLTGAGSATLDFFGTNLIATPSKKVTNVTGSSITLGGITFSGTSAGNSKLTITSKGGNKTIDLGDVSGTAINTLSASSARLTGTLNLPNAKTITLASASGATIQLAGGTSLTVPSVTDTTLTAGALKSLKIASWTGGSISAASIDTLTASGNLNTDLTLTKPLKNATIKGSLNGGTWTLGGVTKLAVSGSVASAWTAQVSGAVSKFTVAKTFSGTVTANVLNLAVNGAVNGATLTANNSVGTLTAKGLFQNSTLSAPTMSKLSLGTIKTHNSGTPFGITANSISSLTARLDTGKSLKLSRVNSSANLSTQLTALKVGSLNDLQITLD